MTDDADPTAAAPDPDDHVARLQAEIEAAKARRGGYRAKAAETVARGGPARASDEELGVVKTDDTVGKIAADASQEIGSRLRGLMSRFRRGRKK
jgi:ribosomal protein L15E